MVIKNLNQLFYDLAYRTKRRLGEDEKEIWLMQMGNGDCNKRH